MEQIFISHSSQDKESFIEPLYKYLISKGHKIWYDKNSLPISKSIPLEISRGLDLSDIYILAISENYNKSAWCNKELSSIISKCIGTSNNMIIIQIDEARIESVISDILRIKVTKQIIKDETQRELFFKKINETINNISPSNVTVTTDTFQDKVNLFVSTIMEANNYNEFGSNLLNVEFGTDKANSKNKTSVQSEGLILIKPGGTFYKPCLNELISRICKKCDIRQIRLFDGETVEALDLFKRQYITTTKLANGEKNLNEEDLNTIRIIYDRPEFEQEYGVPYSDELIVPALKLTRSPYNIEPKIINEYWEKGRARGIFWSQKWNGLNKIGFQKTVYPIVLRELSDNKVRIVLNGFVPGYQDLFINPNSRTIAIHVLTYLPWSEIREKLVGGKSNPEKCAKGSIRKDAFKRLIPLDPNDSLVNGQRNVCHSNATLYDGMRELRNWFGYHTKQTILGKLLSITGKSSKYVEEFTNKHLSDISWTTRDDSFSEILYEAQQGIVFENLKGSDAKRKKAILKYANAAKVDSNLIYNSRSLIKFIENSLRLQIAGEDYYLFTIVKNLLENENEIAEFYEVAKEIKKLASMKLEQSSLEILAEAYRIAASDICFLRSYLNKNVLSSPKLFKSSVLSELPEQALFCAKRTQNNLIKDLIALKSKHPVEYFPEMIKDTSEWNNFLTNLGENNSNKKSNGIIGLILAGGRSTRMSSTIPKPVLPFGDDLLLKEVLHNMQDAIKDNITFYAAIGFRSSLIRRALGESIKYIEYKKILGLAFRLATCLETLKIQGLNNALIMLTYTDMPLISSNTIRQLTDRVVDENTFGLLISFSDQLSGHIVEENSKIKRIIQKRLHPNLCAPGMKRDVGFYVFHNTSKFREALISIKNDNVRQEFIFADIVEILSKNDWKIVSVDENQNRSHGINTTTDLLHLTARTHISNNDYYGYIRNSQVVKSSQTQENRSFV